MEDLARLHDRYYSRDFFQTGFKEVLEPLFSTISDDGGVPHTMGQESQPIFTSTTATCLLALSHINVLDYLFKWKMQCKILDMKDNVTGSMQVMKKKEEKDKAAWCVTEEANVWSTSLALWALLSSNYAGPKQEEIKDALIWLINQQKDDKGWAFQKIDACQSGVYITSLVLRALELGKKINLMSKADTKMIKGSIWGGIQFLMDQKQETKRLVYWGTSTKDKTPDPTNTAMALWTLSRYNKSKYLGLIEKGISYLRDDLGNKDTWEFKSIVHESRTKCGLQKEIVSFTPSLVIILLQLGISPFDPLVLKPISFLRATYKEGGWGFGETDSEKYTFTTAFALWAIDLWHRYSIREGIKSLPKVTEGKKVYIRTLRRDFYKISSLILGCSWLIYLGILYRDLIRESLPFLKGSLHLLAAVFGVLMGLSWLIDKIYMSGKFQKLFLEKIRKIFQS